MHTFNLQPAVLRKSEAALKGAMLVLNTLPDSLTCGARIMILYINLLGNTFQVPSGSEEGGMCNLTSACMHVLACQPDMHALSKAMAI